MFELIIIIIFMSFGIWATTLMVKDMAAHVELSNHPDKIAITSTIHYAEDPFWYTGYQAYMFSWHMDELSDESLSYVGGSMSTGMASARLDGTDNNHVTLSTLTTDSSGNTTRITQFLTWRNQMITGTGNGSTKSVKKTLASLVSANQLSKLYRGTYLNSDGKALKFHLELTDSYSNNKDLGSSPTTGGKTFKWVLAPYYRSTSE
jgi:hypothetical protein